MSSLTVVRGKVITGLTVKDFHQLVGLKVFDTEQMNQAVIAFG